MEEEPKESVEKMRRRKAKGEWRAASERGSVWASKRRHMTSEECDELVGRVASVAKRQEDKVGVPKEEMKAREQNEHLEAKSASPEKESEELKKKKKKEKEMEKKKKMEEQVKKEGEDEEKVLDGYCHAPAMVMARQKKKQKISRRRTIG